MDMSNLAVSILLVVFITTSAFAAPVISQPHQSAFDFANTFGPEPDPMPADVAAPVVVDTYVAQPHQTPFSFANSFGPEADPVPTGPNEFGPEADPPGSNGHYGTKPIAETKSVAQ